MSLSNTLYANFYVTSSTKLADVIVQESCVIQLPHNVTLQTNVVEYGAIVTKSKALANKGDFVQFLFDDKVSSCHTYIKYVYIL